MYTLLKNKIPSQTIKNNKTVSGFIDEDNLRSPRSSSNRNNNIKKKLTTYPIINISFAKPIFCTSRYKHFRILYQK